MASPPLSRSCPQSNRGGGESQRKEGLKGDAGRAGGAEPILAIPDQVGAGTVAQPAAPVRVFQHDAVQLIPLCQEKDKKIKNFFKKPGAVCFLSFLKRSLMPLLVSTDYVILEAKIDSLCENLMITTPTVYLTESSV